MNKNITEEKIVQFLDDAQKLAKEDYQKRPVESPAPTLLIQVLEPNDTLKLIVAVLLHFGENRHVMMYNFGAQLGQAGENILMACFISEVWMSRNFSLAPILDPERREGVAISVMTIDGREMARLFVIDRDKFGRAYLGKQVNQKGEPSHNILLANFFQGYKSATSRPLVNPGDISWGIN